jgi:cell shape-determining protein MreC
LAPSTKKTRRIWTVVVIATVALALLPNRWSGFAPRLGSILKVALYPISAPIYSLSSALVDRSDLATGEPNSEDELKIRLRLSEQEVFLLRKSLAEKDRLLGQLAALRGKLPGDKYQLPQGRAIGRSGDPSARTVEINIGVTSGVYRNDPVISGGYLVGRIAAVSATTSTVELLTSPDNLISAVLVPKAAGINIDLSDQPLIGLTPAGPDRFVEGSAPIDLPVEEEDVARLYDPDWPTPVHGMIVGVVVRVTPDPDRKLRKIIELRPPKSLNHLTRFIVIVRNRQEEGAP